MINILCYGDSNTHGTRPMAHIDDVQRFAPDQRWPGVLLAALGAGHAIVEEGLPGRTTVFDDPIDGAHLNGRSYLLPCLASHKPLDHVVLMLGVNDLKRRFDLSPHDIAGGVGALVLTIKTVTAAMGKPAKILVVCATPILCTGWLAPMFEGGDTKSRALPALVKAQAERHGAGFFDAGTVASVSKLDGIHFEAEGQRAIGLAVAAHIKG